MITLTTGYSFLFWWLVAAKTAASEDATTAQQECLADGTCHQVKPTTTNDHREDATASSSFQQSQPQRECQLFLAPSTIPGAGLGIFSVLEKDVGDTIARGDICIPFVDVYWHNNPDFYPNPFRDYYWMGNSMGMARETNNEDVEAYCPGLDCAVNCHPALENVDKMVPIYDEAGLHRYSDPGAGSRTPYHNGTTYVNRAIPAGGELFKDYGPSWFDYRYEIFKSLPMADDYGNAQELLASLMELGSDNEQVQRDLYALTIALRDDVFSKYAKLEKAEHELRTMNALPKSFEDAKWANEHEINLLHQENATRSIEFLQEHGKCIDHIVNQASTISQAGRGAFAVRNLPKDTIITASPLHHVDQVFANMYKFTFNSTLGKWVRHKDTVVGKQLVLNYCFQHDDSTILFCPYGAGINYINHNPEKVNVKIQWATNMNGIGHNDTMVQEGTLEELMSYEKPVLAFDYVATRDIAAGEELFLDYGDTWQKAWDDHVQNWKPLPGSEQYISARTMNAKHGDSILRTVEEQKTDPYPENLEIRCHKGLLNVGRKVEIEKWTMNDVGLACDILARVVMKGETVYTVEMETYRFSPHRIRKSNIARSSIAFVDLPYSTDIAQPNAFRHPIGIPDDIFPEQWKNKLFDDYVEGVTHAMVFPSMQDTIDNSDVTEEVILNMEDYNKGDQVGRKQKEREREMRELTPQEILRAFSGPRVIAEDDEEEEE